MREPRSQRFGQAGKEELIYQSDIARIKKKEAQASLLQQRKGERKEQFDHPREEKGN